MPISVPPSEQLDKQHLPGEAGIPSQAKARGAKPQVKIPYAALQYLLAFFDATLIVFASVIGGGLYQVVALGDFGNTEQLLGAGFIAAVLYVLIGQSSGFYELNAAIATRKRDVSRILTQWMLVSLLLTLLAFLMKSGATFSRGSIIC